MTSKGARLHNTTKQKWQAKVYNLMIQRNRNDKQGYATLRYNKRVTIDRGVQIDNAQVTENSTNKHNYTKPQQPLTARVNVQYHKTDCGAVTFP